jgi:hypothetical protein
VQEMVVNKWYYISIECICIAIEIKDTPSQDVSSMEILTVRTGWPEGQKVRSSELPRFWAGGLFQSIFTMNGKFQFECECRGGFCTTVTQKMW